MLGLTSSEQSIGIPDHSALKVSPLQKGCQARLLRWVSPPPRILISKLLILKTEPRSRSSVQIGKPV
ncbi:hypothetical protein Tco_0494158 [Tanacetum coccineum]